MLKVLRKAKSRRKELINISQEEGIRTEEQGTDEQKKWDSSVHSRTEIVICLREEKKVAPKHFFCALFLCSTKKSCRSRTF
jgi:hypothetical protein